jgi:hypothetical protein
VVDSMPQLGDDRADTRHAAAPLGDPMPTRSGA